MKDLFKNQIASAIVLGALLIALGIIGYGLVGKGSTRGSSSILDSLASQDKIFQGADFKDEEYILGSTKNDITLVVYTDLECPFCKMLHQEALSTLIEKYSLDSADTTKAKIGIVYKHLPYHEKSALEISAAYCVRDLYGHNPYINFIDKIFEISPTNNGLNLDDLPAIAKLVLETSQKVFDEEEFVACYSEGNYDLELMSTLQEASLVGVEGTPHSIILYKEKGEQLIVGRVSGAREVSQFETIIDKILKLK